MTPYSTGAELTTYATARGITLASDPDVLMTLAHDYTDSQNFIGSKTDALQDNEWPRTDAYFNGVLIPDTEIPDYSGGGSVIRMELETAISIDQGNDPSAVFDPSIKRTLEKVDTLVDETEYIDGGRERVTSPKIEQMGGGLLLPSGGGISFKVVNN